VNRLALMLLFLAGITSLPAQQNGIEQDLELMAYPTGQKVIFWYGHVGRSYFLQVSDPTDHLKKWHWANIIEGGEDEIISHQVEGTADKGFFRLKYTDQVPGTGEDLDTADFDGDGISNKNEVEPPEGVAQTDPLNPDTDGDGLPDGWEVEHNLDPNDATGANGADGDPDHDGLNNMDEYLNGTDPHNPDSDSDGITDGGEVDQGTKPNDPGDTPDAEWFIVTGDLAENVEKTKTRTVTIPAGKSRVIVVVLASDEYPDWTGDDSEYNDTLTWDIRPAGGSELTGSIDVNSRHSEWEYDEMAGHEAKGFSPAHLETGMTLTAPDDAALSVEIELSATNVGDGTLPSTVLVGVLPVVPVEFFPVLQDGDGEDIDGSENPRTESGQTNGMVEEDPVTNRIAHREMKMRIVDGEILESKKLTWTMTELFVRPTGGDPVFRGSWANSTAHPNRYETSAHFGANGFEAVDQAQVKTLVDENGESAIRANLAPVGFNKGRLLIAFEDFEGDPAKVADMEVPAVVVIDPGHGGTDSGAVGSDGTTLEKVNTLAYGLDLQVELHDALDERQPFHRVLITRSQDVRVELVDRPPIARDAGADVFVSVHFNSGVPAARGTETFVERTAAESIATGDPVNNPGDNHNVGEDETLANSANTVTYNAVLASDSATNNRGVKHAGKYVTRDLYNGNLTGYCPLRTCLIEVEFISNAAALASLTGTNAGAIRSAFSENVANAIITDIEVQPNP